MKNLLFKILSLFLIILFSAHSTEKLDYLNKSHIEDNHDWTKVRDDSESNGSFTLEYVKEKKPTEFFIIQFQNQENAIDLVQKYQEHKTDLFSLFEEENPSSLKIMRELRLQDKKISTPNSRWKLIYAFNLNDVIYEHYTLSFGTNIEKYEFTRLIKEKKGFLTITYQFYGKKPTSEDKKNAINHIKSLNFS